MTLTSIPFDPAIHTTTTESQAHLLDDAFASGNTGYIAAALGIVARAKGMTAVTDQSA